MRERDRLGVELNTGPCRQLDLYGVGRSLATCATIHSKQQRCTNLNPLGTEGDLLLVVGKVGGGEGDGFVSAVQSDRDLGDFVLGQHSPQVKCFLAQGTTHANGRYKHIGRGESLWEDFPS